MGALCDILYFSLVMSKDSLVDLEIVIIIHYSQPLLFRLRIILYSMSFTLYVDDVSLGGTTDGILAWSLAVVSTFSHEGFRH